MMRPRHFIPALALSVALAQPGTPSAAVLGVFFDARGHDATREAKAFENIQWFVLALDLTGEVKGYEFSVRVPAQLAVTSRQVHPSTAINVGSADNWIVGAGACVSGAPLLLATYGGMLLSSADNVMLRLEAASPSSVGGNVPAYLTCGGDLEEFDTLLPAGINTEAGTWGRLKHRY
jgi:hypothetical protein